MKRKTMTSEQIFNELFLRYPQLEVCKKDIIESYHLLKTTYKEGGHAFNCWKWRECRRFRAYCWRVNEIISF